MSKILIVEDDDLLRRAWARTLGTAGHQVSVASDAVTAVSTAVAERPDLVLLDLGLPAGNGTVVLQRLRDLPGTAGIRAVVVTGGMLDYDREQTLQSLGCERLLTKPLGSEDLLATVADVLAATPGTAGFVGS